MTLDDTAVIFIGYQNDYFGEDGILRGAIEESATTNKVLTNTLSLLEKLVDTGATLIQTPIIFTSDYRELTHPVGILKVIQDVKAFQEGKPGSEVIESFKAFGDRVETVPGKRGLNAFSNTDLDRILEVNGIEHVVMAGAVTSICIDSTGRAAHERGYRVSVLSDCTAGRSNFEQEYYCENIFPVYATVIKSGQLLGS